MTPRSLVAVLRSRWLTVLLVVLVAALASGLLASQQEVRYTAESLVRVQEAAVLLGQDSVPDPSHSDRFIADELELLTSRTIAQSVSHRSGLPYGVVRDGLDAEQVAGTDVIRLLATGRSEGEAQRMGQAQVVVYLERRQHDVGTIQRQRITALRDRISALERQIVAAGSVPSPDVTSLRSTVLALRTQLVKLQAEQADLPYVGQVVDEPHVRDTGRTRALATAAVGAGVVAGLLLMTLLLVRDWIRRPVRTVDDVRSLGLDVFPHVVAGRHVRVTHLLPDEAAPALAVLLGRGTNPPHVLVTGTDPATDVSIGARLATCLREQWPRLAYVELLQDAEGAPAQAPAGTPEGGSVVATEPPALTVDALRRAAGASRVVLVASVGTSRERDVAAAAQLLTQAGGRPPLVVLVD